MRPRSGETSTRRYDQAKREPLRYAACGTGSAPGGALGIRPERKRATSASNARDGEPSAKALEPRVRVGVERGVGHLRRRPASSSAGFRSASDTKGTPPESSTWACAFTVVGDRRAVRDVRQEGAGQGGDQERPGERRAERGPEVGHGVLHARRPRALCSSGTAETVTAPSWEASAPMPSPTSSIGTSTISAPGVRRRARRAARPSRRTARAGRGGPPAAGRRAGSSFGMPTAAISSATESGSSRTPVSIAESPSATERNSGTTKKSPAWTRYWKKNIVRPPASCRLRSIAGSTSGSPPRASTAALPAEEEPEHEQPAEQTSQITGESPNQDGRARLRLDQAPLAGAQHAEHEQPSPMAESTAPTRSSAARSLGRRVGDPPGEHEDAEHDHDLAGEHPAPGEVRRGEAADQRADGDRDAPAAATSP